MKFLPALNSSMLGLVSCLAAAGSEQVDITNIEIAKTQTKISEVTAAVVLAFVVCILCLLNFKYQGANTISSFSSGSSLKDPGGVICKVQSGWS